MADDVPSDRRFSLQRWSQRKLAAARTSAAPPAPTALPAAGAGAGGDAAPAVPAARQEAPVAPAPLPAVEALSFDSDFTAFMQPEIDPALRQRALKRLFADPRFNVMDGLDVYIDDYGKPDPIDPSIVAQLTQGRYLFDPPRTRVNERGEVEEVPPDDALRAAAPPEELRPDAAVAGADLQPLCAPPEPASGIDAEVARAGDVAAPASETRR